MRGEGSLDTGSGSSAAISGPRASSLQLARRLFTYAKPYRTLLFLGWLATVLYGLSNAALV